MHTEHTTPFAPVSRPLEVVSRFWNTASQHVRAALAAAREERERANLPPHLRHDIGELDGRPPHPQSPDRTLRDRQTSLESMWLRYGA